MFLSIIFDESLTQCSCIDDYILQPGMADSVIVIANLLALAKSIISHIDQSNEHQMHWYHIYWCSGICNSISHLQSWTEVLLSPMLGQTVANNWSCNYSISIKNGLFECYNLVGYAHMS